MNLDIPPLLYFLIAATLLVFGPLRAYYFGWKHRASAEEENGKQTTSRRRHIIWGVVWFVFGVYIAYLGWQLQRNQTAGARVWDDTPARAVRFVPAPQDPTQDLNAAPADEAGPPPAAIKAEPTVEESPETPPEN